MSQTTFPLVSRRRVIGLAFGGMRSARRGLGSDVASSRPYRPGDNVDAIDWAASARLSSARGADEFVVREHYAEESPRVVAVADRRPTMGLGAPPLGRLNKAAALQQVLALIQRSASAARSLVGYLDYAEGAPFWRPPRTEHQQLLTPERLFAASGESLATALDFLGLQRQDLPRGSFVFVASDFLSPPPRRAWARAIEHEWDVVPVAIQDPVWEQSFPDVSGIVVPFADPSSGTLQNARLTTGEVEALREANEGRWETLLADFRTLGLTPIVIATNDPAEIVTAFLRWADERIYVRGRS